MSAPLIILAASHIGARSAIEHADHDDDYPGCLRARPRPFAPEYVEFERLQTRIESLLNHVQQHVWVIGDADEHLVADYQGR